MKLSSIFCFIVSIVTVSATELPEKCQGRVRVRAEWRDLNKVQQDRYVSALQCMYASGQYERFIQLHVTNMRSWHNGAHFLPGHRAYLYDFETEILKCEPRVIISFE